MNTSLHADDYAKADQGHLVDGTHIKVAGRLHPGRQPRQLDYLRSFNLIRR